MGRFERKLEAWWSLEKLSKLGSWVFGVTAGVAGLLAVNFFVFAPHVQRPVVTPTVFIDYGQLDTAYSRNVPEVVKEVAQRYSGDLPSGDVPYSSSFALLTDCSTLSEPIDTIIPGACFSVGNNSVDYPSYLHDLLTLNIGLDPGKAFDNLRILLGRTPAPSPAAAPPRALSFDANPRPLDDAALKQAYGVLHSAATPVDVVSLLNDGNVTALDVQILAPAGLQPLRPGIDTGPWDIQAKQPISAVYEAAPAAGQASEAALAAALPTAGFEVGPVTADPFISHEVALWVLASIVVLTIATLAWDWYTTTKNVT